MAKSRSTFGKRDREMAKAAKASAKRARREARSSEPSDPTPIVDIMGLGIRSFYVHDPDGLPVEFLTR